MKQVLRITEILSHCDINADILQICASHNEGKCTVAISDIKGYVQCQTARFPYSEYKAEIGAEQHILHISAKDKQTLTVEMHEIHGLLAGTPALSVSSHIAAAADEYPTLERQDRDPKDDLPF